MFSGKPVSPAVKTAFVAGSPVLGSAGCPVDSTDRWLAVGICIFLAAIVWLVFGQTVHYDFVNYDDELYVFGNPAVTGGLGLDGVKWAFTHIVAANWHPLTMLSHMLDCQLYGLNASGHHLTNVLLHTASVIVLFLVLRQMTGKLWRSAMVAAMFAVHPLRAESVAWVAERKDVLSGLFFMLTLWAYAGYARRPFTLGRYLWVMILFMLALLSKPMVVTLPFVLLLLDYWPLGRFQLTTLRATLHALRPLVLEKILLFLLAAVMSVVTFISQQDNRAVLENLPVARWLSNVIVSYGVYVWEMIWPQNLAAFYPLTPVVPIWQMVGAGALLLIVTVLAIRAARRQEYMLVGWLWYLGMLVPVIGLVQVGFQSHADLYTYLPQIGLYLLLTWAVADWCVCWRHRRVVLGGVSTVILIVLIFCARAQASYWRTSESLWTHTLACTSDNFVAQNNLGNALLLMGRNGEAMVHFQQALQIKPRYATAHYNLGNLFHRMGRDDEAMVHLQQALQLNPRSLKIQSDLAWVLAPASPAALRGGRRAVELAEQANQAAGEEDPVILRTLAAAYAEAGRFDDAVRTAQKAMGLAQAKGQSSLVEQLDGQLKLYEAKLPFHQESGRFED